MEYASACTIPKENGVYNCKMVVFEHCKMVVFEPKKNNPRREAPPEETVFDKRHAIGVDTSAGCERVSEGDKCPLKLDSMNRYVLQVQESLVCNQRTIIQS
jgi:hypothetical protein